MCVIIFLILLGNKKFALTSTYELTIPQAFNFPTIHSQIIVYCMNIVKLSTLLGCGDIYDTILINMNTYVQDCNEYSWVG